MPVATAKPAGATAIRPFTIETSEADLKALRARIRSHALARKGDR